jgi:hypothetical protein
LLATFLETHPGSLRSIVDCLSQVFIGGRTSTAAGDGIIVTAVADELTITHRRRRYRRYRGR